MPYEREAIGESNSAIPSQPQPTMREERVIDPYRNRGGVVAPPAQEATSKIGQSDTSGVPKVEEPKPKTEESVTLPPEAATLAKNEQKFRQAELALKEREKALDLKLAEAQAALDLKAKLEKGDYTGLEKLVKYDEYTNYLIEKEAGTDPTQAALKEIKGELETVKTEAKKATDKQFEHAVQQRRTAVKELVGKDASFSIIKETKSDEHVVHHILDTWEKDGIELTPEQAAKEVEEELLLIGKKWASLSKIKGEAPAEKTLPPLKPGLKTLTNNVTAGDGKRPPKSLYGLSDAERWAEARRRVEEKQKGK